MQNSSYQGRNITCLALSRATLVANATERMRRYSSIRELSNAFILYIVCQLLSNVLLKLLQNYPQGSTHQMQEKTGRWAISPAFLFTGVFGDCLPSKGCQSPFFMFFAEMLVVSLRGTKRVAKIVKRLPPPMMCKLLPASDFL